MHVFEQNIELGGKVYNLRISEQITETPAKSKKPDLERYVYENVTMRKIWANPPKGLIVHFHAGHRDSRNNSLSTLQLGRKNGYKYICFRRGRGFTFSS